jgi:uncharacterized membrane protein YccC
MTDQLPRRPNSVICSISIVLGVCLLAVAAICGFSLASGVWDWSQFGVALTAVFIGGDLVEAGFRRNFPRSALLYMYLL